MRTARPLRPSWPLITCCALSVGYIGYATAGPLSLLVKYGTLETLLYVGATAIVPVVMLSAACQVVFVAFSLIRRSVLATYLAMALYVLGSLTLVPVAVGAAIGEFNLRNVVLHGGPPALSLLCFILMWPWLVRLRESKPRLHRGRLP